MGGLILIATYGFLTVAGLAIAVTIGLWTDQISMHGSMLLFFVNAAFVTIFAWPLALRLTRAPGPWFRMGSSKSAAIARAYSPPGEA